jgi:hypothetical protein
VTRGEWLSGTDPLEMINFVADRLSDRKLRLFLVACCRRLPYLPADPRFGDAVEAAERFADGACGQEEMRPAVQRLRAEPASLRGGATAVFAACLSLPAQGAPTTTSGVLSRCSLVRVVVNAAAEAIAQHAVPHGKGHRDDHFQRALAVERAEQCRLLRDVAGDPFRPLPILDPVVTAWNDGCVVRLATAAYAERDLPSGTLDGQRLSVLADALEDAGCTDAELLGHLRGPGPHWRGCFALDLILGRT